MYQIVKRVGSKFETLLEYSDLESALSCVPGDSGEFWLKEANTPLKEGSLAHEWTGKVWAPKYFSSRAHKNGDLFADGWPKDHAFTVKLVVVNPGEMAHFMRHMRDNVLLYGCKVERIDLNDGVERVNTKMERVAEKIRALVEELES